MPDKRMKRSSAVPVDDVNGRYELIASVGLDESHRPPRINLKMRAQRLPALHLVEKMKQRFRAAIMKPRQRCEYRPVVRPSASFSDG